MTEPKKKSKAPRPLSEAKSHKKAITKSKPTVQLPTPPAEPAELERLQKVLAEAGVASRRNSEQLILQRRVRVNGEVVTEMGTRIDPAHDVISVDNKPLPLRDPHEEKLYIALHKPRGYVTTADDEQGRETVLDLLGDVGKRVYPVGRLDNNSEGLLLLTNDGDLTFRLTHPSYKVEKEYEVQTDGVPSEVSLQAMRTGIVLDDGIKTKPATVEVMHHENDRAWLRFIISEGRKRQIRTMLEAVGHRTRRLIRMRIGPLRLGDLKRGEHRNLTPAEVYALKKAVGLESGAASVSVAKPAHPAPRRDYSDKRGGFAPVEQQGAPPSTARPSRFPHQSEGGQPANPPPAARPSRFTRQGEGGESYQRERPQRGTRSNPGGSSEGYQRERPVHSTRLTPPAGGTRPFPANGNPTPANRNQSGPPTRTSRPASPFGHPSRPARPTPGGSRPPSGGSRPPSGSHPPSGGRPQRSSPNRGKRER